MSRASAKPRETRDEPGAGQLWLAWGEDLGTLHREVEAGAEELGLELGAYLDATSFWETPRRAAALAAQLPAALQRLKAFRGPMPKATDEVLRCKGATSARYLRQLRRCVLQAGRCESGWRWLDTDKTSAVTAETEAAARRAVGAVLEALLWVAAQEKARAFVVNRPPGHHNSCDEKLEAVQRNAWRFGAHGGCIFNEPTPWTWTLAKATPLKVEQADDTDCALSLLTCAMEGQGGEDLFVPAATSGALAGVLESHNVLAQRLLDLQQSVDALKKNHEEAQSAAAECRTKDEERQVAEAQRAEEGQAKLEEKLAGLEDSTASNVKAIQHSVDEISNHQAELKSRVLPQWEAELSVQIKKISQEVTSFQQGIDERMAQLEEGLKKQREELLEECGAIEPRLTPLMDAAKERLDAAEESLKRLAADLSELSSKSDKSHSDLEAELKASAEAAENFAKTQDETVMAEFTETFSGRLMNLEGALRQSEYERLSFSDRTNKELAALSQQLTSLDTKAESLVADSAGSLLEALESRNKDQQLKLEEAATSLQLGVDACQAHFAELATSSESQGVESQRAQAELQRKTEQEVQGVQDAVQTIKADVERSVQGIRAEEGERLRGLEQELREEFRQRQELAKRLEREQQDRQAELEICTRAAEKRAADVELVANARFEAVRSALDDLVVEFQGFVKADSARSMDVTRLEALVRALEVRVWPWRNGSKERSPSPSSPRNGWEATKIQNSPDWQDWLKIKKPSTSRPSTARRRQEESIAFEMTGSPVGPVGPGMVAARLRTAQAAPM
ncbi:unnamed protein product [Effrenium voratum]|uniref:Histone deacetylase domain-containing protein n=1 Tax=Effrenium voratum TaxID=2562239 RepID=A0AA36I975_9DINO|nr:unnamed protein product [Effrenium voratum]